MSEVDIRGVIDTKIRGCTKCWLHEQATAPVPYNGPKDPQVVILGEAPGMEEDSKGVPFVGPAGRHLKKLMKEAGLAENRTGFCNVVSCVPKKAKGVRSPKEPEIAACQTNVLFQLRAVKPELLLLAGNTALHRFRPEMKITQARGRAMAFDIGYGPVVAIPMLHPSALIRAKSARMNREGVSDLKQARWRAKHGIWERWPKDCYLCRDEEIVAYDANGVPWCEKHEGMSKWEQGMRELDQQMELT